MNADVRRHGFFSTRSCPPCAGCGPQTSLADDASGRRRDRGGRRHGGRRHAERSAGGHVHLGQQRNAEGRRALPRQRTWRGGRRVWSHGASTPTPRLYLPMPFFWVGGFGSGVLSALLAGATLVTEPSPQPEATLRLLERERVTLFRGWPDQAEALARRADSVGADLSSLRPGSLDALLPPELRARPGARAQALRHDRVVRAVLRLPRRHRHARLRVGQLRQAVSRHGGSDRRRRRRDARPAGDDRDDPDPRSAHPARDLRAQP